MKMLYVEWGYPYDQEIQTVFRQFDIDITVITDNELVKMDEIIENEKPDLLFSIDFRSDLSDYCQIIGLIYVSWVIVLPNHDLYTKSVKNTCNFIFICDSFLVSEFQKKGIKKVYYLPDAVPLREYREQKNEIPFSYIGIKYHRQIDQFYDEHKSLSLYTKGYLEGVIQCQRVLRGATILQQSIPKDIFAEIEEKVELPEDIIPDFRNFYFSDIILAPDVTFHEQQIMMYRLNKEIHVYSNEHLLENFGIYHSLPETQEETDMIYQKTSMNIVIPEKNYYDAIPRQTLEIMACGGFVFSGKQKDYSLFFRDGEDLVFYEDDIEREEKIAIYINDENRRKKICENGYEKIKSAHTYAHRILYMLKVLCES